MNIIMNACKKQTKNKQKNKQKSSNSIRREDNCKSRFKKCCFFRNFRLKLKLFYNLSASKFLHYRIYLHLLYCTNIRNSLHGSISLLLALFSNKTWRSKCSFISWVWVWICYFFLFFVCYCELLK